jgi:fibronectin type 3 domain-containing protein
MNWGTGTNINISVMANGIEETSITDLAVPPSGPMLLSGVGDIRGFYHADVTKAPSSQYDALTSTNSLDFAQSNPLLVVRAGNGSSSNCEGSFAYSTDGGQHWTAGSTSNQPGGVTGSGNDSIALSSDGSGDAVWASNGTASAYYTTSVTTLAPSMWVAVNGLPAQSKVRADRVIAKKFYGFSSGAFYVSTDGGAHFTATVTAGLPTDSGKIMPVYNQANDVWLASPSATDGGLWHTSNGGASFVKLANVTLADAVGFGASVTGATYPTLFLAGQPVGQVRGFYVSTDEGNTWTQINDSQHQWYDSGYVIAGDPNRVGRVYIATNGRGIVYGDGAPPSPPAAGTAPAAPSGLSATAVSTTQVNLSWTGSSGVTSYSVFRSTTSGFTPSSANEVAIDVLTTSYSDTGLSAGTTYYYLVEAVNNGASSGPSNQASVRTPTPPPAPTNLAATAASSSQINLSWTGSSGATSYSVFRSTTSGFTPSPSNQVASGVTSTSYSNTGLAANTTYYYYVKACDSDGCSGASNEASATTPGPPSAPTNLSAKPVSATEVDLSWTGSSGASYDLFRSTSSSFTPSSSNQIASGVSTTQYADTGLAAKMTYYYYVEACNGYGCSGPSNEASGTTKNR